MTLSATTHRPLYRAKPTPTVFFGNTPAHPQQRPPFSVKVGQNQVVNRLIIEALGIDVWWLTFARNKFERREKALDIGSWWVLGIGTPILLDRLFNRQYAKRRLLPLLTPGTSVDTARKLLTTPFEWLDAQYGKKTLEKLAQSKKTTVTELLKSVGIASTAELNRLTPAIRRGKLLVVLIDLGIIAFQGQVLPWVKNRLTEKGSGKVGFSGEFNYASQDYQSKQSENYARNKKIRQWIGASIGILSVIGFPALLSKTLRVKHSTKNSLFETLKRAVPAFNYHNAVYMSKWLVLYTTLFNYNLPSLLASRDKHEFRETLTKHTAMDFFYFLGDEMISGLGALWLTRRFLGRGLKTPLVSPQKGIWGTPAAVPLNEIWKAHGEKSLAYRLARNNYWTGLIGTALLMGISTPLLNNWFTRKAVLKEQGALVQPTPTSSEHPVALEHANLYKGFERSAPQAQPAIHP